MGLYVFPDLLISSLPQRMAFVTLAKRNMAAKYTLQSRHRMLSGHEIPVIGYGVSASAKSGYRLRELSIATSRLLGLVTLGQVLTNLHFDSLI